MNQYAFVVIGRTKCAVVEFKGREKLINEGANSSANNKKNSHSNLSKTDDYIHKKMV